MNTEPKSTLSNNNVRRMQGWARTMYPNDWQDRCAVVTEYLAQLSEDAGTALLKKPWPDVFAATEGATGRRRLPAGNKRRPNGPDPRNTLSREEGIRSSSR